MDEVGIYHKIQEVFNGEAAWEFNETGRAAMENEIEKAINDSIRAMLGYEPPLHIKPVVVLDEVTRSASLEELKVVAPEMYRITISEKNEGGDHRE